MTKFKKILFLMIFLFSFVIFSNNVKADSININGNSTVTVNDNISITITYSLEEDHVLEIGWDEEKLSCNSNCDKRSINGSSNPSGTINLSFTAKKEGTATIIASLHGTPHRKDITIKPAPTQSTTTTTTTTTTSTTTAFDKTKDASLKSLKLIDSDGNNVPLSPTFSTGTYSYSANVDGKIDMVTVQATALQDKAKVSGSGELYSLSVGSNTKVTVNVTAEDGTTKKSYTINVYRESLGTDNTLKSLVIKEAPDLDFVENKYEYKITVPSNVKKLTIVATASSEESKVTIEDAEKTKNGSVVEIKDGSVVKITVLAPDGSKKEYKITINYKKVTTTKNVTHIKAQKNPLIIMGFSLIAFGLIGGILYVIKK